MIKNKQCKACPWKRSTRPAKDIPNGYCAEKHARLANTIADEVTYGFGPVLRMMACHETTDGEERPCVGWLHNQLGVGNNIALRMKARTGCFGKLILVGPQHNTFEETLK
jgi:hypothetical protein